MKILLIDDHALLREGVALLLRRLDAEVDVREAGTLSQGLDLVRAEPDAQLILLDLNLPDGSGLDAIKMLRASNDEIPIVVLSSMEDKATVLEALDRGAMGFITKTQSSEAMLGALRLVLSKNVYLPPYVFLGETNTQPRQQASGATVTPASLGLTPRQADVLNLLLQGKPNKVICRDLNLSTSTTKTHISAVLRALNVTTRTQAIVAAGRLGLKF